MGIQSPLRSGANSRCPELELFDESDGKAGAQHQQQPQAKPWWEARHVAFPVCTFAGGPPAARHLAAASRALQKAVAEAWDDLVQFFPFRLYVAGGLDADFKPLSTVERFDPLTDGWESLPKLASPCAGPCAVAAAGRLYVLGGECRGRALCDAQRFDPWLDAWESLPPMHVGRVRAAAVARGGYLYVLGGLDGSRPLRSVERYDLLNRVWEVLPQMQRARYAGAAAVQGHRVLAIGGDVPEAGASGASVEAYDPELGRWELLSALPSPGCGAAMAADGAGRAAFVLGGLGLSGQALGVARRLPLERPLGGAAAAGQSWAALPAMPTPRHLVSMAAFRGGAVAVGGKGPTFEAAAEVEFFDADAGAWRSLPPLPSPRLRAAVAGGWL